LEYRYRWPIEYW